MHLFVWHEIILIAEGILCRWLGWPLRGEICIIIFSGLLSIFLGGHTRKSDRTAKTCRTQEKPTWQIYWSGQNYLNIKTVCLRIKKTTTWYQQLLCFTLKTTKKYLIVCIFCEKPVWWRFAWTVNSFWMENSWQILFWIQFWSRLYRRSCLRLTKMVPKSFAILLKINIW